MLPDDDEVRHTVRLRELVGQVPVTHVDATPSLYDLLLDAASTDPLEGLVYVDVGGEVLSPQLIARHTSTHPGAQLWNCYGPTETTVWATTFACAGWHAVESSVPIGTPVRNYSVAVLDGDLEPVGDGRPGELYVGGSGVARGYTGDPRLTAECFVPDPDSAVAGARRYRTGDVVRQRPDGHGRRLIEFQGRLDDMVKVRGHRIELGEVEHLVRQHPAVREVVVAHVPTALTSHLHAVVVPAEEGLSCAQLATWLGTRLPDYMTPRVSLVDELPRTPNGKLDRAGVCAGLRGGPAGVESTTGPQADAPAGVAGLDESQLDALLTALQGPRP